MNDTFFARVIILLEIAISQQILKCSFATIAAA